MIFTGNVVNVGDGEGLGFAVPYLHNGQPHDYFPDFILRLKMEPRSFT